MKNENFRRTNIYKDIDLEFSIHPLTKDISVKKDINAINQAVKNLLLLNKYEKPFHSEIGGSLRQFLFQPATFLTIDNMKHVILETLTNHEPRIEVLDINIQDDIDNYSYKIELTYTIANLKDPVSLTVVLERIR